MKYVILKELLPSMVNDPEYDESMNFIRVFNEIENDQLYSFDTLEQAEEYKKLLEHDDRYSGRRLKIIEADDL